MAGTARKPAVKATLSAVVALAGMVNAGCSEDPAPPAGTDQASPTSRAPLAIPAVSNPLDASGFLDAPCDLITEQQAGELGRPFEEKDDSSGGVACILRADKTDPNPLEFLRIKFFKDYGLAEIAQQCKSRDECDSWTIDTISSYPVIRANGPLESKYGFCRLFVGIADNVALTVNDGDMDAIQKGATEGDAGGPRCDRADRAATFAIQTLKEGR